MDTKSEAEAKLAALPLQRAVAVEDVVVKSEARRRYSFSSPSGVGGTIVDIPADPSPGDLQTLADNLPLPSEKRGEVVEKLKPGQGDGKALLR